MNKAQRSCNQIPVKIPSRVRGAGDNHSPLSSFHAALVRRLTQTLSESEACDADSVTTQMIA